MTLGTADMGAVRVRCTVVDSIALTASRSVAKDQARRRSSQGSSKTRAARIRSRFKGPPCCQRETAKAATGVNPCFAPCVNNLVQQKQVDHSHHPIQPRPVAFRG